MPAVIAIPSGDHRYRDLARDDDAASAIRIWPSRRSALDYLRRRAPNWRREGAIVIDVLDERDAVIVAVGLAKLARVLDEMADVRRARV